MIEAQATGPGTTAQWSLVACVASLLELEPTAIPAPGEAPLLVTVRQWLAERGLGLVAVAEPQAFSWAGPWIAQLSNADGVDRHVIMFGVPSGVIFDPLGRLPGDPLGRSPGDPLGRSSGDPLGRSSDDPPRVAAGYLLAPLEAPRRTVLPAAREHGRVEAIFIAPDARTPMRRVEAVAAIAGKGLEGDRYAKGEGTFSVPGGRGHEVTLISGEVLDALALPDGRPLSGAQARRNIVTRGVDLNALVGRRFRIGELELIGRRRCEPCAHLQRLTRPGVLRALVHRGGLRADLLESGSVRIGDPVTAAVELA